MFHWQFIDVQNTDFQKAWTCWKRTVHCADDVLKNCGHLRFSTSSLLFVRHHFFRKKNKFYFSVHPLWFRMTIWWWSRIIKYYTTCLVSDDVAIQCNRPIKLEHLVKYETIYHTFSSCRRPSQPIGWFQIRHTHFIFDTHIFPFTWCADFTYYFYFFFDREKIAGHIKRNWGHSKDKNVRFYVRIFLWRRYNDLYN